MKKLAIVMLVLIMVASVFGGCKPSAQTGGENSANLDELEAKYIGSETPVELAVDGASNYVVIRSKQCGSEINTAAAYVMKQLKTTFGCSFSNNQDDKEDFGNEILIGDTNRKESGYARELLIAKGGRSNDWIIGVMGQKIVIYGMTDAATKEASEYFVTNYAQQSSIDQKLCYYKVADASQFKEVKLGDTTKLLKFKVVRARYNVSYVEQLAIEELCKTILDTTGYQVDIVKDELSEATDYEIILGETTREGEEKITDYDAFSINPVGNKLYLNGGHTYSRAAAVKELSKLIAEGKGVTEKITGSYANVSASYDGSNYKLAWTDEFDASALDTSMWIVTDMTSENKRALLRGDGMYSYRSAANVYVKDGKLYQIATYDDNAYYGTYMINIGNMCYKYGVTEASIVIPYGVGLWTSFWLTNDERDYKAEGLYGNEINIQECHGANYYAANMHRHATAAGRAAGKTHTSMDNYYSNQKRASLDEEEYFYQDFHTVAYIWKGDMGAFALDGEIYFDYKYGLHDTMENDLDAFDEPLAMRLTMAVGFQGDPIKGASYWQDSNKQIYDYVHVYQDQTGWVKVY